MIYAPDTPQGKLLDASLAAALIGDVPKSQTILEKLYGMDPESDRVAFNLGWHRMRDGHLLEGQEMLDRGRFLDIFGNRHPGVTTPMWDGESTGTVLLYLEGGLGDQIHCARYATNIIDKGCKVILSCSGELVRTLSGIEGVNAVIQHEATCGIYHDFWVPAMSAPSILGLEYKDLDGGSYLLPSEKTSDSFKVGIRFSGNPKFEHEQHRLFPWKSMINAVEGFQCINLQPDMNFTCDEEIDNPPLNTWEETRNAISQCSVVVTSCTSVAHMAAAMGIYTWIVVPILPYYLWALPGNVTPHYDTVSLYRQVEHGNWDEPFQRIRADLLAYRESLQYEHNHDDLRSRGQG